MHHAELLQILAMGLSAALILGFITHRLKLSPIVGYLLAGFLVGPNSPGFVADAEIAGQLAEVGVILLMFGVGLHFDLKDLLAVKSIAIPGAIVQSLVATVLGALVAVAFGLTPGAGVVLGLGIAVASTVVLIRGLVDHSILDTPHGHVAVGWLIVEDIFTVLVLVLLPTLAATFAAESVAKQSMAVSLGAAVMKLAILGVLILMVGGKVVPWVLSHVARSRSRELFTLAVLVLAFAVATGSAVLFGASTALGAFLAGMVVGKSRVSDQAAADVLPMRDAFAVLFFVSVGMLFDPVFLISHWGFALAILAVILIAKPLAAWLVVALLGYSVRTALTVAIGLAQIGEFTFILAQQAQSLKLLSADSNRVLVACALISITLNPLLFRALSPLENWLRGKPRLWRMLNRRSERKGKAENLKTKSMLDADDRERAIVVGYGPVGQTVARILHEAGRPLVVIDLNVDTVTNLVSQHQAAVYGDASHREILLKAGIEKAKYLLITLPESAHAIGVITSAKDLNPECRILVRARYQSARELLEGLGVKAVSVEEEEVAKAMVEVLMNEIRQKGTPAQSEEGEKL